MGKMVTEAQNAPPSFECDEGVANELKTSVNVINVTFYLG